MIGNITKLGSSAQINYPKEGAIRDYYFAGKEGEGIARCLGGAARHLGLEHGGHVSEKQYDLLSAGIHPTAEEKTKLMRGAGKTHRPGWDITLSDPKWGSLVYAFNGGQAKDDYLAAKRAAVEAVVREVERLARPKARKRSGEKIEMVFSEFVHDDNRAGEPQLHSHLIAHNIARFQDGTFGAVEMLPVMRHKAYLGQIYQNVIAQQMRARGYDIAMEARESQDKKTKTPYLVATLDNGAGKDAVERAEDAFGKRRAETVGAIEGEYSAAKAKAAAAKTGKAKSKENVIDRNRRWDSELSALGPDMEHLFSDEALKAKSLEAGPPSEAYEKTMAEEALRAEIERIIGLSVDGKNGGWIYEHDIAAAVARSHHHLPTEELPAKIEAAIESLLPKSEREEDLWKSKIVALNEDGLRGMRKFVAVETLRREARLVETLDRVSKGESRTVSAEDLEAVVGAYENAKGFQLSENQRFAVEYVVAKSGNLAVIEGVAGAGKTTLLEPSVSALRLAGYDKILGCAPTAKAANELGASLGEGNSSTVHKLLSQIERGTVKLDKKSCVVLDEAGMLGVKEWAELAEAVEKAGAKLCVIGDRKQFQAVGMRGGMDAAVKAAGEFVEVFENRRQDKALTGGKDVGDAARSADPEKVVGMLLAEKALAAVEDEDEAIGMLARDYAADGVDVMKKMAICETNGISEEINLAIRRELKERGVLGAGLEVETELGPKDETYKKPAEFSAGDKIMFLENSREGIFTDTKTGKAAKVQNGLPALVTDVRKTAAGVEMVVECGGRSLRFNTSDYARFTHGYCHSAHKAQGATTQKTYAFLEGSAVADAGSAYVLLTRHKETVSAYATEESLDSWRKRAAEHADCRLFSEAAGLLPKAWAAEWAARTPRALRSSADRPMTAEERKARPRIVEPAEEAAVEAGEKARRAIDEKEALVADLPKQEALAEKAALAKDEAEAALRDAPAQALGGPVAAPEAPAKGEARAQVEKPAKTPERPAKEDLMERGRMAAIKGHAKTPEQRTEAVVELVLELNPNQKVDEAARRQIAGPKWQAKFIANVAAHAKEYELLIRLIEAGVDPRSVKGNGLEVGVVLDEAAKEFGRLDNQRAAEEAAARAKAEAAARCERLRKPAGEALENPALRVIAREALDGMATNEDGLADVAEWDMPLPGDTQQARDVVLVGKPGTVRYADLLCVGVDGTSALMIPSPNSQRTTTLVLAVPMGSLPAPMEPGREARVVVEKDGRESWRDLGTPSLDARRIWPERDGNRSKLDRVRVRGALGNHIVLERLDTETRKATGELYVEQAGGRITPDMARAFAGTEALVEWGPATGATRDAPWVVRRERISEMWDAMGRAEIFPPAARRGGERGLLGVNFRGIILASGTRAELVRWEEIGATPNRDIVLGFNSLVATHLGSRPQLSLERSGNSYKGLSVGNGLRLEDLHSGRVHAMDRGGISR